MELNESERTVMPMNFKPLTVCIFVLTALLSGCKLSGKSNSNTTGETSTAPATANGDDTIASGTGVEKEKPAAGKGNVQGKALYNGQPAKDVEVKLCEKFNQYFGGCGGVTFVAKNDGHRDKLNKNVPARIYER